MNSVSNEMINNWIESNLSSNLQIYYDELNYTLKSISDSQFKDLVINLENLRQNKKNIFLAGNGGSNSNANHASCDLGKNIHAIPSIDWGFKTYPLENGFSNLTAISNDYGYEKSFSKNLELLSEKGDGFFCMSVSGKSPNILNALRISKKKELISFGIYGNFDGEAIEMTDFPLIIKSKNYGIVEDIQMILIHSIVNLYQNLKIN